MIQPSNTIFCCPFFNKCKRAFFPKITFYLASVSLILPLKMLSSVSSPLILSNSRYLASEAQSKYSAPDEVKLEFHALLMCKSIDKTYCLNMPGLFHLPLHGACILCEGM